MNDFGLYLLKKHPEPISKKMAQDGFWLNIKENHPEPNSLVRNLLTADGPNESWD